MTDRAETKMPTTVVNVRDRKPIDYVYIGSDMYGGFKGSPFANPYKVGKAGITNNEAAVLAYYKYIIASPKLLALLYTLKDQKLGCWCKNSEGKGLCHGDVLVYLIDRTLTEELQTLFDANGIEFDLETPIVDDWGGPVVESRFWRPGDSVGESRSKVTLPVPKAPEIQTNRLQLNRVAGMLMGCFLGDALGVPHEFPRMGRFPYTGRLEHRLVLRSQFQPPKTLAVGQYSDDSEMTIALTRTLITDGKYTPHNIARAYIAWANSETNMIGRNTRALFKGSKKGTPIKLETYVKHYAKEFGLDPFSPFTATSEAGENMQSNGALMRCSPLACLGAEDGVYAPAIMQDCWMTNPSTVAYWCEFIYLTAVRLGLLGHEPQTIWDHVVALATTGPEIIQRTFQQVRDGVLIPMDVSPEGKKVKGWVICAFYTAMSCLYFMTTRPGMTFETLIAWVIGLEGDTDTNAAISGALIGSLVGYDTLIANDVTRDNIAAVIRSTSGAVETDIPRSSPYQLADFTEMATQLHALGGIKLD